MFLGDLPRDTCLVELYEYLKRVVGGDFELVLKRSVIVTSLTLIGP